MSIGPARECTSVGFARERTLSSSISGSTEGSCIKASSGWERPMWPLRRSNQFLDRDGHRSDVRPHVVSRSLSAMHVPDDVVHKFASSSLSSSFDINCVKSVAIVPGQLRMRQVGRRCGAWL
ncbi:hypothetical protein BHE74_00042106 [Ensete ventricosum]|nr:hypothetical protein GW17_00013240 [Ensete ventricosum]RWW51543.1 hypothetical protein BHE74_00042106 [Ensete ventricosum]RZR76951.1 hypothetical protein BHM03_00001877 [Ensete ventricosum]